MLDDTTSYGHWDLHDAVTKWQSSAGQVDKYPVPSSAALAIKRAFKNVVKENQLHYSCMKMYWSTVGNNVTDTILYNKMIRLERLTINLTIFYEHMTSFLTPK